ncbi:MAG TPA: NAD(P)H-dependent oxidoreductase subunit E [Thermoanaerobaculia bacterium]
MDLRVSAAEPTVEERDAVDAVLGAPESGWVGGARNAAADGRFARGGAAARAQRHLLLPALHAVQDRVGWVSEGALNYVSKRLTVPPAEAWGVVSFYHLFATAPRPACVVHVCDDLACRLRGAEGICDELAQRLGSPGSPMSDGRATWLRSPCLGLCEQAPAALVVEAGTAPRSAPLAPLLGSATVAAALRAASVLPALDDTVSRRRSAHAAVPQVGDPSLRLLRRIGVVDPTRLALYRAAGGYAALTRAIELGPRRVIDEVVVSKLVGRGGAAFPTGRKWQAVAAAKETPHYLVCNADESEPGTFKDRVLMEEDPFALVEAMTIAALATGCERGFVYLRGEYPRAHARLAGALAQAREANLLGADVAGAGFAFDIDIRRGAGAYICGEETALFESIEGYRGEPRSKPPFPVEVGLFGKPTVVNNVETLVNVLPIVLEGGAAYGRVGTSGSAGPKLFCVSGQVERPGLYEVAFGTSLGELLALAGGVAGGRELRAVLLGGAAGAFVGPDALATPLTFEGTRAAGATLGSGVVMVFDESADLGDALLRIAEFFRHESCGQCVPCRVGTVRQHELVERLRAGRPLGSREQELALLAELAQAMRDASICGLGQTASSAIESALARLDPFPEH